MQYQGVTDGPSVGISLSVSCVSILTRNYKNRSTQLDACTHTHTHTHKLFTFLKHPVLKICCLFTNSVQFDGEDVVAICADRQHGCELADTLRRELHRNVDTVPRPSATVFSSQIYDISLSPFLTAIFPGEPGLAGVY